MSYHLPNLDSPPGSIVETEGFSPVQKKNRKRIAVFLGEEEEASPPRGFLTQRRLEESNNTSNGGNSVTTLNQSGSFTTAERQELAASSIATYYTSMGFGPALVDDGKTQIVGLNTSGTTTDAHPTSGEEATRTISSLSTNSGHVLGRSSSRARRGSPAFLPALVKSPPESAVKTRRHGPDDSDSTTSPSPKTCPLPKPSAVAKKVKEVLMQLDDDDDF